MKYILISLIASFLFFGCASKRFVKKGLKLENAGLYSDATNNYYNSLLKNNKNIDAKIGLQRTGQLVLDDKIDVFKAQYNSGTVKDAVYAYRDAEAYFTKLKAVGMQLILSEEQKVYYQEVEDLYLNKLYAEATKALKTEEFVSAESQFAEILNLNANYKDAKSQWVIAYYEPIYRKANDLYETQMYRSAYLDYTKIVDGTGTYKNCRDLQISALQKAKVTIAINNFKYNKTSYKEFSNSLQHQLGTAITKLNSPFYELVHVEDNSTPKSYIINRGKLTMEKPEKIDYKASINANIKSYTSQSGSLRKTTKQGYIKRIVKYYDKETKETTDRVYYDKVKYYEYRLNRKVALSIDYAMERIDKNQVVISNSFSDEAVSELHYATFEGDVDKLIPGKWKYQTKDSDGDVVYDNANDIKQLKSLLRSSKKAKSLASLEESLVNNCMASITKQVLEYKPEN